MRWVALMARHGGDGPVVTFTPNFFDWLGQHIVSVQDSPYPEMDYRGDPDIPLWTRNKWGDLGESFSFWHVFNFLNFYMCFLSLKDNYLKCMCLIRPAGMRWFDRWGKQPITVATTNLEAVYILTELEQNLESLTLDILDAGMDDIPLRYQRHAVGVPGPLRRLLHWVACVVVFYHEHHHA